MNTNTPYKLYTTVVLVLVLFTFTACKSADTAKDAEALTELVHLLEGKNYSIQITTAQPTNTMATTQVVNALLMPNSGNTSGLINVRGNDHFIKVVNDSVSGDLAFFGERQIGSGGLIGKPDGGIKFNGLAKDFEIIPNNKKNRAIIKFSINEAQENYQVNLNVFPNNNVYVFVFSSHRTNMRYNGKLVENQTEDILE